MAADPVAGSASPSGVLQTDSQTLLDYAQALIEGEELMFTMDVPYVPPQEAPVVLAQGADTATQPDYLLKTCDEVPSAGGAITAMNMVDPAGWLVGAVLTQAHRRVSAQEGEALMATVKLTQLQGVTHGQLISHSPSGRVFYEYRSEPGYVGKDQVTFLAEFEGKRYKIIANVVVSMTINENSPQCPPPTHQGQRQTCVWLIQL